MVWSRMKYKVEYQKMNRENKKLHCMLSLLESSDETKRKICLDMLLEYLRKRQQDEVNYTHIRDIPLSDFQIWLCRWIKFLLDNNDIDE